MHELALIGTPRTHPADCVSTEPAPVCSFCSQPNFPDWSIRRRAVPWDHPLKAGPRVGWPAPPICFCDSLPVFGSSCPRGMGQAPMDGTLPKSESPPLLPANGSRLQMRQTKYGRDLPFLCGWRHDPDHRPGCLRSAGPCSAFNTAKRDAMSRQFLIPTGATTPARKAHSLSDFPRLDIPADPDRQSGSDFRGRPGMDGKVQKCASGHCTLHRPIA
jgi:hypothetical protein